MSRKHLLLMIVAASMVLGLVGCTSQKGAPDAGTGNTASSKGESVTEEKSHEQTNEVKWLSYDLKVEELRDMDDSDHFSVKEAPSDSRYVVVKLVSTGEEIAMDEITEDTTKTLILKDSDGTEYEPGLWAVWGIEFDEEMGFSTNEKQEGFNLLYVVPKTIATEDLSLELK